MGLHTGWPFGEVPKRGVVAGGSAKDELESEFSGLSSSPVEGYNRAHMTFGFLPMPLRRVAALLLLSVSGMVMGCAEKSAAKSSKEPPKKVSVAKVELLPAEETVYATGTLAAMDRAVLSAKVPGRVEEIRTDLGSVVKKGEVLAQIEKTDFELKKLQAEAAMAQARARLGLALSGEEDKAAPETVSIVKEAKAVLNESAKNRERIGHLREQGIIAEAELETVEANYQVALNRYDEAVYEAKNRLAVLKQRQVELNIAEQELIDTTIRAPFDGVVASRQTSPGEYLKEATPILTLVRIDPIRLRAEVSEKDAPRVKAGQTVRLEIEGAEQEYQSKVSRLSPVITADNRMLIAEADFQNAEATLRPGSFGKIEIVVNPSKETLFIPSSAVVTFAGMQKVFVINSGKPSEREVRCGRHKGNKVEVISGLKRGETVVLEPGNLRSGQAVETAGTDT
jgi:membrane fusion protein (multidrug efflux system)